MAADMSSQITADPYYKKVHERPSAAYTCGRQLRIMWRGLAVQWETILSLEPGAHSVLYDCGLSIGLMLPTTVFCVWIVATKNYSFGSEVHDFLALAVGFAAWHEGWAARTGKRRRRKAPQTAACRSGSQVR